MCGALPAGHQLEPTTNNEDVETDETSHGHNNDRARAKRENGDRVRATYGCLSAWRLSSSVQCVCRHRARVVICIADCHAVVNVTETSHASGGSDPRERWAPSRADAGRIITSAVGAKGPHPWHTLPEDDGRPNEAVWCAEHDLAAIIMFLSLRKAFQAEDFPNSPTYLPSPPALLSTVLRVIQNCSKKRKPENRLCANKL